MQALLLHLKTQVKNFFALRILIKKISEFYKGVYLSEISLPVGQQQMTGQTFKSITSSLHLFHYTIK